MFNIGGTKYRLITHIDYATEAESERRAFGGRVHIFDVLTCKVYDTGKWKKKDRGC